MPLSNDFTERYLVEKQCGKQGKQTGMAIILGIDPGSRVTGYGVIRQQGRQLIYLGSGCIRTVVDDMPTRLKLIYAGVTEIITQFQPVFFCYRTGVYGEEP